MERRSAQDEGIIRFVSEDNEAAIVPLRDKSYSKLSKLRSEFGCCLLQALVSIN